MRLGVKCLQSPQATQGKIAVLLSKFVQQILHRQGFGRSFFSLLILPIFGIEIFICITLADFFYCYVLIS